MNSKWRLAYDFQQRWSPFPRTLQEWQRCDEDMIATACAGENTPFLRGLLIAVWNEFERQSDAEKV